MQKDVAFLRDQGLMDYSLLLGIEQVVDQFDDSMKQPPQREREMSRKLVVLASSKTAKAS